MLKSEQMALGTVLRVGKYRGKPEGFIGRVTEVRDIHDQLVQRDSRRARRMTRSRFLVTLEAVDDPTKPVRSFYHAFASDVEVLP
jgi:hypothetical protein